MELTLTGVAHGGEAVGRSGDLVTFAAYGLPGERVQVEILEQKPRFSRGRVVEVLEPAPERVTAPCPIFGTCGGCHWQHADYAAQLAFKTTVLRDQLVRLGKFPEPPLEAAVPSPQEWHYRNTVQFVPSVAPDGATRVLCFQRVRVRVRAQQAAPLREPVPVEHCYIADPLIDRALHEVPWAALSDSTWSHLDAITVRVAPAQSVQITLVARAPLSARDLKRFARVTMEQMPVVSGVLTAGERAGEPRLIAGDPALVYEFASNRHEVPAGAFVQVNLGAAELVLRQVEAWLEPRPDDVLIDAYAGTGAFALALAGRVAAVTAIESHRAAAEAGVRNAGASRRINVGFQAQPIEQVLQRAGNRADLVVLDPPRRGCAPEVVDGVAALGARRIAYVSCEPSTLARDLRRFCDQGYDLVHTRVVDMFPQTFHLESVSLLQKR